MKKALSKKKRKEKKKKKKRLGLPTEAQKNNKKQTNKQTNKQTETRVDYDNSAWQCDEYTTYINSTVVFIALPGGVIVGDSESPLLLWACVQCHV